MGDLESVPTIIRFVI